MLFMISFLCNFLISILFQSLRQTLHVSKFKMLQYGGKVFLQNHVNLLIDLHDFVKTFFHLTVRIKKVLSNKYILLSSILLLSFSIESFSFLAYSLRTFLANNSSKNFTFSTISFFKYFYRSCKFLLFRKFTRTIGF